ncbi:MAG: hypothetical protein ACI4HI_05540 [Lachnospiraceae bacterium]
MRKKICIGLIGAFYVFTILLFLAMGNHATVVQMKKDNGRYADARSRQIFDEYDQRKKQTLSEFLSQPDAFSKLKSVYATLQRSFGERYVVIGNQTLEYLEACDLDEEFIEGGEESRNEHDPGIGTHTPLYSIQIDRQTADSVLFKELLKKGMMFSKNDYKFHSLNQEIPLIMGSNYEKKFKLGDTFSFSYLQQNFTGRVTGFLKKDAKIQKGEEILLLDNQIICPYLEVEKEFTGNEFTTMLYFIKTEGEILYKTRAQYQQIEETLHTIRKDTGILYDVTVDDRIVLDKDRYQMPCSVAAGMEIGAEILFLGMVLFVAWYFFKFTEKNWKKCLIGVPIVLFLVYKVAYQMVLYVPNDALAENIRCVQDRVAKQMLLSGIVWMVILVFQYMRQRRKESV